MKGIIFDLDGTLIDSMPMWKHLDQHFIESKGMVYDSNISYEILGMNLEQAADHFRVRYQLPMTAEQIVQEWNHYLYEQYTNAVKLKPGVLALLDYYQSRGVKMCIATLTDRWLSEAAAKRLGLMDYMEFLVTANEVGKSKQFPDIYDVCATRMSVTPKTCVVMEDTLHAVITAKNAGYTVYGIYDETSRDTADIQRHSDKFVVDFGRLMEEEAW